jgi:amidase
MLTVLIAMMIAESVNNTFGRTVNPLNRNLTSGGSSGGESALISFRGSLLGVGTDIGKLSHEVDAVIQTRC